MKPSTLSPPIRTSPAASPQQQTALPRHRARSARRFLQVLGSLPLALALLTTFTACLVVATLLESLYSAPIARALVYQTWWFTGLLALLALNVVGAAIKKFPWKRHQTGFLITHSGLLVLLLGGLWTLLAGIDGQMLLIDTDNTDIQRAQHLPQTSDSIQLADENQIDVYRFTAETSHRPSTADIIAAIDRGEELSDRFQAEMKDHHWTVPVHPGPFAWHAPDSEIPAWLRPLMWFAMPRQDCAQPLDDRTTLTVKNFHPTTEAWPYGPANDGKGFPVLRLSLTSSLGMFAKPTDQWVAGLPHFEQEPGPVSFEMLRLLEPALLPEFLHPPPAADLGKLGQLVLLIGPERRPFRIRIDPDRFGHPIDLPGTGLKLTLKKFSDIVALVRGQDDHTAEPPRNPTLQFTLTRDGSKAQYLVCSRLPDIPILRQGTDPGPVAAWYHYPDFRAGNAHLMGSLQFLQAPDGRVYYRVYGKDGLRQPGQELDVTDHQAQHDLPWKPMEMRFQVTAYLPDAMERLTCVPHPLRLGADPPETLAPAVHCVLAQGDQHQEVWLRMMRGATRLVLGKDMYLLRYRIATRRLDFTLTLQHAEQQTDPGTDRPAAFQSDVVLHARQNGQSIDRPARISMNQTLDHGRYKIYQTNYRPILDPDTVEPVRDAHDQAVSLSGLTVAHDPGLYCKYAGSFLVVLGIATMFTMKAYFFRPAGRRHDLVEATP